MAVIWWDSVVILITMEVVDIRVVVIMTHLVTEGHPTQTPWVVITTENGELLLQPHPNQLHLPLPIRHSGARALNMMNGNRRSQQILITIMNRQSHLQRTRVRERIRVVRREPGIHHQVRNQRNLIEIEVVELRVRTRVRVRKTRTLTYLNWTQSHNNNSTRQINK